MGTKNTTDQAFLRGRNLSAVLKFIYRHAPVSRAQLATRTGLNKSTVSSLVQDLMDRRLIHETGMNSAGAGRPATLLEINPDVGAVIGVELGVDFVAVALADFAGRILMRKQVSADPAESQDETLQETRQLISETLEECGRRELRVLGLSFSIPGTVDLDQGLLIFAPNLSWRNVSLRNIFSYTGLPVYVENDANAAAVGEHLFGAAQDVRDFVLVFAGVGIGGGLYLNDQLYRGRGGYAGEIGHTSIRAEPSQQQCLCGNRGCWETYANQHSIIERVERRLASGQVSLIPAMRDGNPGALQLSVIKQAADAGDEVALHALAEAGSAMGSGLAGLVNIFNPQKIVLGGPVSLVGAYLMPTIREGVSRYAMSEIAAQTEIGLSAFGADASLIGAAAVVVDDILNYPTRVEKEVMLGVALDAIQV
jgi:glucokinase-like ROK family protein